MKSRYDSAAVNLGLVLAATAIHVGLDRAERYPYRTRWMVGSG